MQIHITVSLGLFILPRRVLKYSRDAETDSVAGEWICYVPADVQQSAKVMGEMY